jgi:hypothetical protein
MLCPIIYVHYGICPINILHLMLFVIDISVYYAMPH